MPTVVPAIAQTALNALEHDQRRFGVGTSQEERDGGERDGHDTHDGVARSCDAPRPGWAASSRVTSSVR